jgi:protein-disulfide isomerase
MASEEEKSLASKGSKMEAEALDLSVLRLGQPVQSQAWVWGCLRLGIILLVGALGLSLLGYLTRPAPELASGGPTSIPSPTERVTASPAREVTLPVSVPTRPSPLPSPTSTRVVKETPTETGPVEEPTSQINLIDLFPTATPGPTLMALVLADDRHAQGPQGAPVTILQFSDFKCPYCGEFATETLPQLRRVYIETGQVRFVYRHFPILGPESDEAAAASECATEQGRFWEYHDQIFADQVATRSSLTQVQLSRLAEKSGLNLSAFAECLASGRYASPIRREAKAVRAMGLRGTPSFLVNGVFLVGAHPFETFHQVIEEQLQGKDER